MKKALSRIVTGIFVIASAFLVSCLAQILITSKQNHGVARIYGHSFLYVVTDSMVGNREDSLPVGTGVIVRQVDVASLHAGDIVSFYDARIGAANTHRLDVDPVPRNNGYRLHTMADNVLSQYYSYEGETFTDTELLGLVIGHHDGLGWVLSFVSPAASAAKEVAGGGMSMAWLFPLAAFLPIVGVLSFQIIKLLRKGKEPAVTPAGQVKPIDSMPVESTEEDASPLDETAFVSAMLSRLLLSPFPSAALLAVDYPPEHKTDVAIAIKDIFAPQLIGESGSRFLLFLSPAFSAMEIRSKAQAVIEKVPTCCFGIAFYPDINKEELFISTNAALAQGVPIAFAQADVTPKAPLNLESALREIIGMGFDQAALYLASSASEGYFIVGEATKDGYAASKESRCVKSEEIDPYLFAIEKEEIGFVLDATYLPIRHGKNQSFYAKKYETGAILFLCKGRIYLNPEQIHRLLFLSDFLANQGRILHQKAISDAYSKRMEALLKKNCQHAYEVDRRTRRITYVSTSLSSIVPHATVGTLCHKALYGSLSPCPRCPLDKKTDIKKPLPCLGSEILSFSCVESGDGKTLIILSKAKGKAQTPLTFIEEFESMLRSNKSGLILLIQPEGKEEENRLFLALASTKLDESNYWDGRFDYDGGFAYLFPNLSFHDALSIRERINPILESLDGPKLSYYRFSFPDGVTCRLELEACLRAKKKNVLARGQNVFVDEWMD